MPDGVSRSMNFQPILDALRAGLQQVRQEMAQPIDVDLRVKASGAPSIGDGSTAQFPGALAPGMGRVPTGLDPSLGPAPTILPGNEARWTLAPSAGRYYRPGAWDGPENFPGAPDDRLAALAGEGWGKITAQGAYHTLQEAGRFGRKWGTFLGEREAREQREWSDAAASPEGRKYMDSMEETEKIGKRISILLKDLAAGGPGARAAADDLKKAQEALEAVGKAGKAAAESLGGEMGHRLAEEQARMVAEAGSGRTGGGDGGDAKGPGAQVLFSMLANPRGALQKGLLAAIGGNSALTGALALPAAAAAGVYLGYQFNAKRADKGLMELQHRGEDARFSRGLGPNFDFRGSYWKPDRIGSLEGYDTMEARRLLGTMGVGLNGMNPDGIRQVTEGIRNAAMFNGIPSEQMAHVLGAGVKSGTATLGGDSALVYLKQMTGYLQRTAEAGITSNGALQSIAILNGQQVQALGRLSEGSQAFTANLLEALDKTGDPALRDTAGAGRVAHGLGHLSGNQVPMVLGRVMKDPKKWEGLIKRHFGKNAGTILGMDRVSQLKAVAENPAAVMEAQLGAIQGDTTTPSWAMGSLYGVNLDTVSLERLRKDPTLTVDKLAKEKLGQTSLGFPRSLLGLDMKSGLAHGEITSYLEDRLLGGASAEMVRGMKGFSADVDRFGTFVSQLVDKVQFGGRSEAGQVADQEQDAGDVKKFLQKWGFLPRPRRARG